MIRTLTLAFAGALFLTSCTDPALQQKVDDLEKKVAAMEATVAKGGAAAPGAAAADPNEQTAQNLLREATGDMEGGNYDAAKAKIDKIVGEFGGTRAARSAARVKMELDVIGKDAPALATEKWYQGAEGDSKATLLVFWEVWCPHCRREVPKLEETFKKYGSQGLGVVGLTKQTRDITDEQVTEFIKENNISYPVAKEAGQSMSDAFGVRGVPAAAVVKDGKVVWRGHPARIDDAMIEGWL